MEESLHPHMCERSWSLGIILQSAEGWDLYPRSGPSKTHVEPKLALTKLAEMDLLGTRAKVLVGKIKALIVGRHDGNKCSLVMNTEK